MQSKLTVSLTQYERKLFSFIKLLKNQLDSKTEFRVAGGWIRDKILGKESDDIDIVMNDISGVQMIENISANWINKDFSKITDGFSGDMSKIHVIHNSSEEAEHLKTGSIIIHDQEIDFATFRHEEYIDSSRVPSKISQGNIDEDCKRRDFTINAMYYNLETDEVEDISMKGLEDIKNKIIRTTKNAEESFSEDPLRVIRAFRFACRYDFQLDSDILEALNQSYIIDRVELLVNKERLNKEIHLLFKHVKEITSYNFFFKMMIQFDILERVFRLNSFFQLSNNKEIDLFVLQNFEEFEKLFKFIILDFVKKENLNEVVLSLYLATWILPYKFGITNKKELLQKKFELIDNFKKNKFFNFMIKELKFEKKLAEDICNLNNAIVDLVNLISNQTSFKQSSFISNKFEIAQFIKSKINFRIQTGFIY